MYGILRTNSTRRVDHGTQCTRVSRKKEAHSHSLEVAVVRAEQRVAFENRERRRLQTQRTHTSRWNITQKSLTSRIRTSDLGISAVTP